LASKNSVAAAVHGDLDLAASLVSGFFNGLHDDLQPFFVGFQVRGEATFIANCGAETFSCEHFLEVMEDFDTGTQGFAEAVEAKRHDHEFLDIESVVGVCPAIDDVHHGCGETIGADTAEITKE
jgi:hypothetical protein